jgi:hypothetical protein
MAPEAPPALRRAELELLQRAQELVRADPARALALVEGAARRFPGSPLIQEREVIAIEALRRLGRAGEAHARGEGFLRRFPRSAYRLRVESLTTNPATTPMPEP